jgi:biopolymer transport protein ExbB
VASTASAATIYVDGVEYARISATLPSLDAAALVGADFAGKNPFMGELDELTLSGVARSASWIKFAAVSQSGTPDSLKLVALGNDEGAGGPAGGDEGFIGHTLEHMSLFGDIAKNMMFDGWIAVGICIVMMAIGWVVALRKFAYLKKVEQGTEEFLARWKQVSTDLTALDHADAENVKSLAGNADASKQRLMQQSPLYQIYHVGSEEIRHRLLDKRGFHGLSARSITAIKASLDASLTREVHRLNSGLVSLTIGIAGGPYVGLMGTVVGVMITFAVIAKTGQVEVNSIAPGIASALLATVFGLLVAIPALFLYSFLNSRIKDAVSNMQLFIDEFITKMAEFYPVTDNTSTSAPFIGRRREADDEIQETTKK